MMHPKCFFSPFYSALQSVSFLRMGKEAGGERGVLGCPRSPTLRWDLTSLLLEYLEKAYLPLEAGVA